MNYRITLAYDGTDYFGWQLQTDRPTIQGVLNEAVAKIAGVPVTLHAAGRTDTGVHAEGQIVSFRLAKEWEGKDLRRALNAKLPPDIRVLQAEPAADRFHARIYAKAKIYRYQIFTAEIMNPFLDRYAWHHPRSLDVDRLLEDSRILLGTHDFTAFTVSTCVTKTRIRTVTDVRIEKEGELLKLFFTGTGFLRYQVRTMVGALAAVNRGRLKAGSIAEAIANRDRTLIGAPAPARGLTLMKVEY